MCNGEWEKLSIFLNMLIPKLPSPQADDLSQGIDVYKRQIRNSFLPQIIMMILLIPSFSSTSRHCSRTVTL